MYCKVVVWTQSGNDEYEEDNKVSYLRAGRLTPAASVDVHIREQRVPE